MTETDWPDFVELFEGACRLFGKRPDAVLARDYFDALADYPLGVVTDAKHTLVKASRFFPRVRDWRHACDTVAPRRTVLPQTIVTAEGHITRLLHCPTCEDIGWRPACGCPMSAMNWRGECPAHPRVIGTDGRVYRQAMSPCACRDGNPVWQANRQRVTGAARDAGGGRE